MHTELQNQALSSFFCPLIFEFITEKWPLLQQSLTLGEDTESTSSIFCAGGVTAKLEDSATTLVSQVDVSPAALKFFCTQCYDYFLKRHFSVFCLFSRFLLSLCRRQTGSSWGTGISASDKWRTSCGWGAFRWKPELFSGLTAAK